VTITLSELAPDLLLSELRLVGPANTVDVIQAVSEPPSLERTLDGASSLTVVLRDQRRQVLRSGVLSARSYAIVDGLAYQLMRIEKTGDSISLIFEDLIAAALRKQTGTFTASAGSVTLAQLAQRFAVEAGVTVLLDPATAEPVNSTVERGGDGTSAPSSSWSVLGDLADRRGLRRFTDGRRLLIGSDDWLSTLQPVWKPAEHTGPAHSIDFTVGTNPVDVDSASLDVDGRRDSVLPGRPVDLTGLGPADGRWVAQSFTRLLTRQRATLTLVRPRRPLPEPPMESLEAEIGPGDNAPGVDGILDRFRLTPGPLPAFTVRQVERQDGFRDEVLAGAANRLAWPTYDKRTTSEFGPRRSPGGVGSTNHQGLDIGVQTGTKVFAAGPGKVQFAGRMSGYGLVVFIDHGNGLQTRYAHLSLLIGVAGREVTVGSLIGLSGATGNVTGPHLHFETRLNGVPKNPRHYLP
jgi:hypothetical protein